MIDFFASLKVFSALKGFPAMLLDGWRWVRGRFRFDSDFIPAFDAARLVYEAMEGTSAVGFADRFGETTQGKIIWCCNFLLTKNCTLYAAAKPSTVVRAVHSGAYHASSISFKVADSIVEATDDNDRELHNLNFKWGEVRKVIADCKIGTHQ